MLHFTGAPSCRRGREGEHGEVGEKNNGFGKKIRNGREGAPVLHHAGEGEKESTEKWGRKIMVLGKKSSAFVSGNLCAIFLL